MAQLPDGRLQEVQVLLQHGDADRATAWLDDEIAEPGTVMAIGNPCEIPCSVFMFDAYICMKLLQFVVVIMTGSAGMYIFETVCQTSIVIILKLFIRMIFCLYNMAGPLNAPDGVTLVAKHARRFAAMFAPTSPSTSPSTPFSVCLPPPVSPAAAASSAFSTN